MRRFLLLSSLITIALMLFALALAVWLGVLSPFKPGHTLFPIQRFVEDKAAYLYFDDTRRTIYFLDILEKRYMDMGYRIGTKYEMVALHALNRSLDRAISNVNVLNEENAPEYLSRLSKTMQTTEILLGMLKLVPDAEPGTYSTILAKIKSIRSVIDDALKKGIVYASNGNLAIQFPSNIPIADQMLRTSDLTIDPRLVEFLPGSVGTVHAFYPLIGQHAVLQCEQCHPDGQYSTTSNYCSACHINQLPANHFSGDCGTCHNPNMWTDIHFNHAGQTDCQSCHTRPSNHYSGQCSSCHSTNTWKPASFNHAGQTNCQSCHTRPANHYSGQCSSCHSTNTWKPASFNHAGQTNCQSCHTQPSNHYSGQCSSCHSTSAWKPASFNHAGQTDCQSCHARPSNHYSGQCSNCHSTNAWKPASFNHAGQTDCQSCHARPSNHYSGQCSSCHSTNAWKPASFNHAGQFDCQSCHARPSNHYSGQCSSCHDTSSWSNANIGNHRFPIDHKGAGGVCSRCHPSGGSAYTCYTCHNKSETEKHHAEEDILNIASRCADCHPKGKEEG